MTITADLIRDFPSALKQQTPSSPEERQLCYIWVDTTGQILDCDDNTQKVFGYRHRDLKSRHISNLIPSLTGTGLMEGDGINPRLAYRSRCAVPFQMVDHDGHKALCNLFINRVTLASGLALALICVPLPTD
ncbi:MAG TPA: PAS domain-containing protein [Halothiobacillus sp.]|jgi:hypothetical protein|nr:PAS domain-containing protein [Halothiobacillus sp.]HUN00122.1 PAS domain-containing protein [Halothiobacillus sp.]